MTEAAVISSGPLTNTVCQPAVEKRLVRRELLGKREITHVTDHIVHIHVMPPVESTNNLYGYL
jgi:hypothetical protein